MAKQLIIVDCSECPHMIYHTGCERWCHYMEKSVDNTYRKIPSWCPLNDADVEFKHIKVRR